MNETSFVSDYLDPANQELLQDFFAEAESQVEILEMNLLALENDPTSKEAVDEIFRAAHTLKGGSATVQMQELTEFTHLIEDVLDEVRGGGITVDGTVITQLLKSIDIIKAMLAARSNNRAYSKDISALIQNLKNLKQNTPATTQFTTEQKPAETGAVPADLLKEYELLELQEVADGGSTIFCLRIHFDENNPMNTVGGIQIYAALKDRGKILRTIPEFEQLYEDKFFPIVDYYISTKENAERLKKICFVSDVTTKIETINITAMLAGGGQPEKKTLGKNKKTATEKIEEPVEVKEADKKQSFGSVLRVDSRRIDELLNLVTETVINKASFNQLGNQFSNLIREMQQADELFKKHSKKLQNDVWEHLQKYLSGDTAELKREFGEQFVEMAALYTPLNTELKSTVLAFKSTAQNLNRISSNLQTGVMQIRMVHVSQIFSRFPRLVRDLSRQLDKKVKLNITGEETELDKSVIEDLLDPLIHCVRNSIDHGMESPEERKKAGKNEEGNIYLRAENEGNMIIIEIEDDGKGIDVEYIRQRAVEKQLIHPDKNLSDVEAFHLIFEPGFSTAKEVTNISGRGVGLDVVRKQIEKLSGAVSVWSELGKGTKFTIQLPLTLAIIPGLLVKVGQEIYAIPIASVLESLRLRPSELKTIDNYEVFNLREDVISLIRLNRIFNLASEVENDHFYIVVVGSTECRVGLVVDSLIGEEDVVIKPLKDRFTKMPGIAGATILGDGTVALIIDINQLVDFGIKLENMKNRTVVKQD